MLALRILSASSNKKQEAAEAFLQCFIHKYAQLLPACAERKFTAIKATTALITIKHGDQHSGPNRNPNHNQIETKIYYSFRHVDVLTRIAKIHVVTIYIRADAPVIYMSQTCGLI